MRSDRIRPPPVEPAAAVDEFRCAGCGLHSFRFARSGAAPATLCTTCEIVENHPRLSRAAKDDLQPARRAKEPVIWPLPSIHDWCGEHQPREAAQ